MEIKYMLKDIKKEIIKNTNEKGQVILVVIVAMTIALSVGIAISSRTLSMLSRTTKTDTATRVFSVAEGGIERFLSLPYSELETMSEDKSYCPDEISNVDNACLLGFEPSEESKDKIKSRASVTVDKFRYNSKENEEEHYNFSLQEGVVKEVTLDGYDNDSLEVCWNFPEDSPTALYYIVYGEEGILDKAIITPSDYDIDTGDISGSVDSSSSSNDNYLVCHEVSFSGDAYGIRFRSFYGLSEVGVFPKGGDLPVQGYVVTSKGELTEEGKDPIVKIIKAYKSYPYMPSPFDDAIYTEKALN